MPTIRTINNRRRAQQIRLADAAGRGICILIPSGFEPRHAEVGEVVKIGFRVEHSSDGQWSPDEWMWAKVVAKDGDNYEISMLSTSYYGDVRAGRRISITSANILTTEDNCPFRAAEELADLMPGQDIGHILARVGAVQEELGLTRRQAVEHMLVNESAYRAAAEPAA